jgi:uncharacterized protein YdaU (DUF1376 family)
VSDLKWHKRNHHFMLADVADLTLEEGGAYNQLLDLLYIHDGAIEDDDRSNARLMRLDVRKWRRIRDRLLDRKKLYRNGPTLRSEIADRGVEDGRKSLENAKRAGFMSAQKRSADITLLKSFKR